MLAIPPSDVLQKIDEFQEVWREFIPEDNFDWFVARIKTALETFYPLSDLGDLSAELQNIEQASKHPSPAFVSMVTNASPSAREVLEQHGTLPIPPLVDDKNGISDFANEIRARIIAGERWQQEGRKRRRNVQVIAKQPFRRPKRHSIDVLVSLVATAYSGASGAPTVRAWSHEKKQPIEVIIGDVFDALGIDDTHSANEALRRHIRTRDSLNPRA